jgi:hypothetical protein
VFAAKTDRQWLAGRVRGLARCTLASNHSNRYVTCYSSLVCTRPNCLHLSENRTHDLINTKYQKRCVWHLSSLWICCLLCTRNTGRCRGSESSCGSSIDKACRERKVLYSSTVNSTMSKRTTDGTEINISRIITDLLQIDADVMHNVHISIFV